MPLRACLLALFLAVPFALPADEVRPTAPLLPEFPDGTDDAQDLLYLGKDRPIFVRLHLRVDGRSFRDNWSRFADGMFREFDQNADGVLAENEWGEIPGASFLIVGNTQGARQGVESVRASIDRNPSDGLVTREEFADYLQSIGSQAVSVQALGSGDAAGQPQSAGAPGGAGNRLFFRLDEDRDGKLSGDELNNGTRLLTALDFDEDGAMSHRELLFAPSSASMQGAVSSSGSSRLSQFVNISTGGSLEALSRQLLDQYDHPEENPTTDRNSGGDDRLTPRELPIPGDIFKELDRDGDGALSFEELQGIGRHCRPALVVTARIGTRQGDVPQLEVVKADPELPAEIQVMDGGSVLVFLGGDHLDFSVEADTAGQRVHESLLSLFKAADRDNNSYLERSETPRTVFALGFDSMDEDGDGRLFQSEFTVWLARREAAAASRCQMNVANDGRNLFDNLDVNRDGRVTPRELRSAPERTRVWDIDADSKISPDEVPAHYRVVFGRSQPEISGLANFTSPPAPAPVAAGKPGSGWFQRMDRNHDGEITRREFLGSRALFERYDRNRDGVIEPGEADAARP